MDNDLLRKVQLVQLQILIDVDRVCRENNIKYWLAGGTQLGAVRHKGFIPWDDDLDIAMKRDDYNRFKSAYIKESGCSYYYQDWETNKGYGLPFAKVRKKGTKYIEAGSSKIKSDKTIYVDVFPYDNLPEEKEKREQLNKSLWRLFRLLLMKKKYTPWLNDNHFSFKRYIAYLPYRVFSKFFSSEALIQQYGTLSQQYNRILCDYMFNSGEPNNTNNPMKAIDLSDLIEAEFEGHMFYIPRNYDAYLTTAYGDYMILPPENKRGNWHAVIDVSV